MARITRRTTLKLGAAGVLGYGLGFWKERFAAAAVVGPGPFGPLGDADRWGVRLPAGFTNSLVAMTGQPVGSTSFVWVGEPDGAATFPVAGGGWIYAANSELNGTAGGAAAIEFAADGTIVDAYRILAGTKWNCAGGATPWGTWLSGEEFRQGHVWECDPTGPGQGVMRPALGTFAHEASVVDPATGWVYLTEDDTSARFYRFRPSTAGNLARGTLEAARVAANGTVTWVRTSPDTPERSKTTTAFNRSEGAWFSDGYVYFSTTGDDKIWAYHTANQTIEVIYDAAAIGADAPLRDPDNLTVHPTSGEVFVGEDADDLQLVLLSGTGAGRVAAPFLQLVGHANGETGAPPGQDENVVKSSTWQSTSEITGLAFTPDGSRLYVTSQRGRDGMNGMTFEISGPFSS